MLGLLLIILSPVVGALPGPGGVFVFAAGLALTLKNSEWAKRQYVRFKRWQPKAGGWADWGLRRGSYQRREEIRKRRKEERAARRAARAEAGLPDRNPDPPEILPEASADREGSAR